MSFISITFLTAKKKKKKKSMQVTSCLILLLSLCQVCVVSSKGRNHTRAVDNDDVISLIVGGTDAGVGVHTHQVALFHKDGSFSCGGILVAHDVVITAEHCVDYVSVAKIGLYFLNNPTGSETISICGKVTQPNGDDIALLKLCQVSSLAQQGIVKTIKLNASPSVPTVGQVLTVTGWGDTTEGGTLSNTLQKVDVNYISQDTCTANYDYYDYYPPTSAEMCAGVTGGGKDSCQGDSGGPLVIGTSAKDFVLVGVVSRGLGCARPNAPGIYNRISSEVSWVLSQGCAMTAISPCGIQTTNVAPVKPVRKPFVKPAPVPAPKPAPVPALKPAPIKPAAKPAPIKPVPIKPTPKTAPIKPAPIKPATKPVKPAPKPVKPTSPPKKKPSRKPSKKPSGQPTDVPTAAPSVVPSAAPSQCYGSFAVQNNSSSVVLSVTVKGSTYVLNPGDNISMEKICETDTLVLEDIPV